MNELFSASEIKVFSALADNYIYLLDDILVDPGAVVDLGSVKLRAVLLTHHHTDHVAGSKSYSVPIIGPAEVDFVDEVVKPKFTLGSHEFETIFTPGHTLGHVCYFLPKEKILFSGDTLFGAGCGRLFEGDAAMLFTSLQKLKKLPDDTQVFYGHEYTEKNLRFAQTIEPKNEAIAKRLREFHPRVFPTLGLEKETNPFLRAKSAEEFAKIRLLRDTY